MKSNTELEQARKILRDLEAKESAKVWSNNETIRAYLASTVEPVLYKGERQTNSNGQAISRIPIGALAELVAFFNIDGFHVQAGQKYVNLIEQ